MPTLYVNLRAWEKTASKLASAQVAAREKRGALHTYSSIGMMMATMQSETEMAR